MAPAPTVGPWVPPGAPPATSLPGGGCCVPSSGSLRSPFELSPLVDSEPWGVRESCLACGGPSKRREKREGNERREFVGNWCWRWKQEPQQDRTWWPSKLFFSPLATRLGGGRQ